MIYSLLRFGNNGQKWVKKSAILGVNGSSHRGLSRSFQVLRSYSSTNNLHILILYILYYFICRWYEVQKLTKQNIHKVHKAHKVLQSDSTQIIDHIQKCFRQKFQCSRRPSHSANLLFNGWRRWSYVKVNSTFLNGTMYFFSMTFLPILRRIQRPTTQGHSSHAKCENNRKIETYRNFHF